MIQLQEEVKPDVYYDEKDEEVYPVEVTDDDGNSIEMKGPAEHEEPQAEAEAEVEAKVEEEIKKDEL